MTLSRHNTYVLLSWLIMAAVVAVIALVPGIADAQSNTIDTTKLRIGLITRSYDEGTVGGLIFRIVDIVLLIAGIIAFFYVLYGGFMYLTAGADPGNTDKGRKTIFNALIGIIIISISYALVTFVASQTRRLRDTTGTGTGTSTGTGTGSGTGTRR